MIQNELKTQQTTPEIEQELDEVLEGLPEDKRKQVTSMMISATRTTSIISPEAEAMKKITSDHVTQFLEGSKLDMENSYKEKSQRKIFQFSIFLVTAVFLIIVIVLLKSNPNILEKVLYAIGGVVAGAFGGYGYGKNKTKE